MPRALLHALQCNSSCDSDKGKACHCGAQRCRVAPGVCQQCVAPKRSASRRCCTFFRLIRVQTRATRRASNSSTCDASLQTKQQVTRNRFRKTPSCRLAEPARHVYGAKRTASLAPMSQRYASPVTRHLLPCWSDASQLDEPLALLLAFAHGSGDANCNSGAR